MGQMRVFQAGIPGLVEHAWKSLLGATWGLISKT